jgi:hypothetical protein
MNIMKILSIVLSLVSFSVLAQVPVDETTKRITYSEVVEVPGSNKDDLYTRAEQWFAKTYASGNDVVQFKDREAGKIIGKARLVILHTMQPRDILYTITLEVKDGRYRYTLTDFYIDWINHREMNGPLENVDAMNRKKAHERTHEKATALLSNLKIEMTKPIVSADW